MTHTKLGFLVVLALAVLVAPALAGDCIKLKNGKWHQPGPAEGQAAPTRQDFDKSPYTVTSENYDKITFSMKLAGGKGTKMSLDAAKVDSVHYWPVPPAFASAANAMNNGDYPTAVQKFTKFAGNRSERFWARVMSLMNVAAIYEADAKWNEANQAWERLTKDFSKSRYVPKAFIQMGLNHLNRNDENAAKVAFGKLGRLSGLPDGQKALAKYYLIYIKQRQGENTRNQSQLREALGEYRSLLSKSENDSDMKDVAILTRLGIGTCLVGLGQFDEALAFFQKIADSATDPAVLAGAFNGLGNCYFKKQKWQDALLAFLRVEILYDGDAEQTARALFFSGKCFQFMLGSNIGEDSKVRAKTQYAKCASRFPGTKWAQDAKEASAAMR